MITDKITSWFTFSGFGSEATLDWKSIAAEAVDRAQREVDE